MGKILSTIKEFRHLILAGLGVLFFVGAFLLSHTWHAERASVVMWWAGVAALIAEADTKGRVVCLASLGCWTLVKALISMVGRLPYLPDGGLDVGLLYSVPMSLGIVATTIFLARRLKIAKDDPTVIERTIHVRVRAVPRKTGDSEAVTIGEEAHDDPAP